VPARGHQAQERGLEGTAVGDQEVGRDVALQVVDRGQRQVAGERDRLGRGDTDQQRADQPGPLGDRDERDVVEGGVGRAQRVVDDVVDQRDVTSGTTPP
jgi:hypothetical protein